MRAATSGIPVWTPIMYLTAAAFEAYAKCICLAEPLRSLWTQKSNRPIGTGSPNAWLLLRFRLLTLTGDKYPKRYSTPEGLPAVQLIQALGLRWDNGFAETQFHASPEARYNGLLAQTGKLDKSEGSKQSHLLPYHSTSMDGEAPIIDPRQSEIEQKRMDIACIKRNLEMSRMPLSETIVAISNHCFENAQSDPLLFPPKDNPYKPKRTCFAC
ncbi:hypothetical protein CSKR_103609 [Clonorchis sinensis]|uniref:Uncharacterized protein n=1 Tax=Clonorchis sinensis TaxID=79923 RepID=A0A419PU30_CLOSI|nr:hypothetical protein CSKR_103609 [Clonorchis sinensis]